MGNEPIPLVSDLVVGSSLLPCTVDLSVQKCGQFTVYSPSVNNSTGLHPRRARSWISDFALKTGVDNLRATL
jgi:hypothetical protein